MHAGKDTGCERTDRPRNCGNAALFPRVCGKEARVARRRKKSYSESDGRVGNRAKNPTIPELSFSSLTVKYPEGTEFKFGNTTLRFSKPLFHGIEFSRVGWVFYTELIIYDHHLPLRERTKKVWDIAKNEDKKLFSAAEFLG